MPGGHFQDIGVAHDDADNGNTDRIWDFVQEETGGIDQKYWREREHGHGQVGGFHCPEDEIETFLFRIPEVITAPKYAGPITGKLRAVEITKSRIPDMRTP